MSLQLQELQGEHLVSVLQVMVTYINSAVFLLKDFVAVVDKRTQV